MNCTVTAPNGVNKNCTAYMSKAIAMIGFDPSFSWASVGAVDNLESLRVLLQETRKGFVIEFNETETTASEPVDETTGFGQTITTEITAPMLVGYVKTNACDFVQMLDALNGGTYGTAFFLSDGQIMVVDNLQAKSPALKGFSAQIFAINVGIPGQSDQTKGYRVKVNFQDASEFRNYRMVSVHYGFNDLMDLLPLGLDAKVSTPWDGLNQIVLDVSTRCVPDSPKTGVLTAEVVGKTQGLTVTATPTAGTAGIYTVVVQKSGATDLAAGEYARFQLVSKTGDVYNEISNIIEVEN